MADLMTGTYTYEGLEKTYGGFMVPAAKIKINGSDITAGKKVHVEEISVCLSAVHASSVTVRLGQCYDFEKSSFESEIKNKAVLGNVLEAELGYGSSTLNIFKGYIASVGVRFDEEEGIGMEITALDVRRLMMVGGIRQVLHEVKNYSEAFETVMKSYKKLCSVSVDATSDNLEQPLSQGESDYDFVMGKLIGNGRTDREFLVVGDTAYFRKPGKAKSPVIKLGLGKGIRSFERNSGYISHEVEVIGYDPAAFKTVTGTAKAKSSDQQAEALASPGKVAFTAPDVYTEGQAKARAQAIAERLAAKNQTGTVSCVGIPQIVPGRYVELVKMDSLLNKKYYVTEVRHQLDGDGFETSFDVGGWS